MINIGLCVLYVLFTGNNFKQVFEAEFQIDLPLRIWIILSLPIMLLISSVRSLKMIAPFSFICSILYFLSSIVLIFYLIHDLPSWQRLPAFGSFRDLPLYFGIAMFAFECTTVVLPISNKLADTPALLNWNGVLNTGYIFGVSLYGVTGFFGYLKTGQNVQPIITLNLPNEWYYQFVKIMFVIAIWACYAIQFYVPISHAEEWIDLNILHENERKRTVAKWVTRYGLVLLTYFLALLIPNISSLLSLIGSFTMTSAVLIIPTIIDLLHAYARNQSITYWHYARNGGILIFSLIGMISGTYSSIYLQIADEFPNQALFILIKALIGAGLLSLPFAFKYSGLWLGLFLLAIISIANFHCIRLLVIAEQFYCQTYNIPTLDYGNVARLAVLSGPERFRLLDNKARVFVNVLIYTINIGLCVVYVVFTATNFKQVFETEFEIFFSLRIWIILSLPIMVLIGSVRSLKVISFLSLCCALLYMSSLIILFAYLIHDLPPWQRLPTVCSLKDLPLYFGITMNAFECTTAILPITNKMAEPHAFLSWNGVLNTGFIFGTTLYGFAGFFGYLKTGQNAEPTITLNLPNEWYYQIVKIMFVIAVWGSYVIQFYVPIYHAEEWIDENILHENDRKRTIVKRATRYGLVLLTIFLAFFIPNISLVLSLIGSFTMTLAVLIIPSIIDLLHAYAQDQSITYWHYAKNIGILIFALIGMISGTYSSIRDILNEMF